MARIIKHDIGEDVLLLGHVTGVNVNLDGEVLYRVRIDGLGGDHWIPEADIPATQSESTRTFVGLEVRYPDPEVCPYKEYKGKPYYSIKYIEDGVGHVGYGTYNPEVLSQYLREYFMPLGYEEGKKEETDE